MLVKVSSPRGMRHHIVWLADNAMKFLMGRAVGHDMAAPYDCNTCTLKRYLLNKAEGGSRTQFP